MGRPLLRLRGVGREYVDNQDVAALAEVYLEIHEGDFLAIEGPSGGGKSTLLNVLGLLDHPSTGSYEVSGDETVGAAPRKLAELRSELFAFVFQSFHLLDRRPVMHSVEMTLSYRAVSKRERRLIAVSALDRLGIVHLAWQKAGTLSGGERQRVAIARALTSRAKVVLADEPTGNLDSSNSARVVDALRELNQLGSAVVLVTHSPEVAAAANRRVRIQDGLLEDGVAPIQSSPPTEWQPPEGVPSRMRAADLVGDALASVASRKSRSAALASAVALAVGLAVGSIGIAGSARAQVSETFDAHANREVTLEWTPDAQQDDRVVPIESLQSIAGVDSGAAISDYGQQTVGSVPGRDPVVVSTFGVAGDVESAGRLDIQWNGPARLSGRDVLVGQNLADQLGIGLLAEGPQLTIDGVQTPVAGVIKSSPRIPSLLGTVLMDESAVDATWSLTRVTVLLLTVPGAAQQVARQAPLAVDPVAPERIDVYAPVDPTTLRAEIESDVLNTLYAFTVLALLAAMAGLANSMVMSVLERRHEFGLRRAVGARGVHVTGLVLVESVMVGLVGGVAGLVLGFVAILSLTIARHWIPIFDLWLAPAAVIGGTLVGVLGGLAAAVRANHIDPAEALRT